MAPTPIDHGVLRDFLVKTVGCVELEGPNLVRFEHHPTKSIIILRRHLPEEIVSERDLALVRKTLVDRGAIADESFDGFLESSALADKEFDFLFHLFSGVCELGEALHGKRVLSNRLRMEAFDMPYDADFHRAGALDELMTGLHLNGEPLSEWSTKLSARKCSPKTRSIMKKIGEAIYPLIYSPHRHQAKTKQAAFEKLGSAALDLKNELQSRSPSFRSLAADAGQIWPSLAISA